MKQTRAFEIREDQLADTGSAWIETRQDPGDPIWYHVYTKHKPEPFILYSTKDKGRAVLYIKKWDKNHEVCKLGAASVTKEHQDHSRSLRNWNRSIPVGRHDQHKRIKELEMLVDLGIPIAAFWEKVKSKQQIGEEQTSYLMQTAIGGLL